MKTIIAAVACAIFAFGANGHAETTEWTDTTGRKLSAALRGYDGGSVIFQTSEGKETRVPLARLSHGSQMEVVFGIETLAKRAIQVLGVVAPAVAGSAGSDIAKPVFAPRFPAWLQAPDALTRARYLEAQSKDGAHVYRSSRFHYLVRSGKPLSPQVMQDVARVFEGTYLLLGQSPFGREATPLDGFFRLELFETMDAYHKASGPAGSAGVYLIKEKKFMVPFESLGLKLDPANTAYIRDRDFEVTTLVHELTHMMMHDVIHLIPKWLIEGSAEYVECIPYKNGVFTPAGIHGSVKEYNERRRRGSMMGTVTLDIRDLLAPPGSPPPPDTSGQIVPRGPIIPAPDVAFYHTSLLLTYYFMHLDGDGKGTRLLNFLNAVRADNLRWDQFERAVKGYEAAMEEFFKKPGVERLAGGRFTFPSHLTPPEAPKPPGEEHMKILLDGRTVEQLAAEAEAALTNAGLFLTGVPVKMGARVR